MAMMTLKHVLTVVETTGCTRMVAYDGNNYTLAHVEAKSKSDLQEDIRELVANTSGIIRMECWCEAPPRQPGVRKVDQPKAERYTFHVRGELGLAQPHVPPVRTDDKGEPLPAIVQGLDTATAVHVARMEWKLELLQSQLKERDEYEDPSDEPEAATPAIPQALFGMTGDQTFAVLNKLAEVVVPLLSPGGARTIGAAPAVVPASAEPPMTDMERQLFAAVKRWAQAQPEVATGLFTDIMENFGPNAPAQPPPNGSA